MTELSKVITGLGFNPDLASDDLEAASWVLKALDPADAKAGAITGIPDHNDQPTTVLEYRQISQIAASTALGLTTNDTWDVDILFFEGPYILAAYQMRNSGDPSKQTMGWITNEQFNWDKATGPYMNEDGSGNVQLLGDDGVTAFRNAITGYRPVYSSTTGHCNAASLTDQGMLVAGQIPNSWIVKPIANIGSTVPTYASVQPVSSSWFGQTTKQDPNKPSNYISDKVPTFDTVLQASPYSGSWRAKEGWYIPLRYQQPDLEFTNAQTDRGCTAFIHPWAEQDASNQRAHSEPPDWLPSAPDTNGSALFAPISLSMRAGAVCIKGVQPTTSFSIHFRFGYEFTVPVGSILAATTKPSCPPSDKMLEQYFKLRHQLQDAYPERYNSKELLNKMIRSLVPVITNFLPSGMRGPAKAVTKALGAVFPAAEEEPKKKTPKRPTPVKSTVQRIIPGGKRRATRRSNR